MSNAAITIRTDAKTKRAIADFAASVGLSTSAFATVVLMQAVRSGQVVLSPRLEPTEALKQQIATAKADYASGKNIVTVNSSEELDALFEKMT